MKRGTFVIFLIVWVCFLLLAALLSPSTGRASDGLNLLQNSGFEAGTEGWLPDSPTTEFVTTTLHVHLGEWAASLNRTDGVADEIHIYQDVLVVGGGYYTLSGWAYKDDPNFGWVKLRLDWRDASDTLLTVDSPLLTEDQAAYEFLSIDSAQAPINATRARIKCVADIQEAAPETPIFFDDLSFTFQGLSSKVYLPLVIKNY